MNEPLAALAFWLADFLALATVLLAVAALAMWRLKHPAQRMAVAWATMAGLTALLLATAAPAWPRWDLRHWLAAAPADDAALIEKPINSYHEATIPLADDALPRTNETLPAPSRLPTLTEAAIEQRIDWPAAIAIAWLACATAAVGWIALGAVQAWRLLWTARQSPPWAQTELARIVGKRCGPRLKTSEKIGSAVALGAVRPAILLPAEHVREENFAGVKAALAHEWAHIRHGDLWLLAWQRLLLPILAAHPLFWLLRRQIRADQELLADCAAAGEKPVEYAEALLAWAKQSGPRPSAGLAALAMWENPQTVSRRIQMILDPKNPVSRPSSRWSRFVLIVALAGVVSGLSTVSLRPQPVVGQDEAPASAVQPPVSEPVDSQAVEQGKGDLEPRRAQAAGDAKLSPETERENARIKQRIEEMMMDRAWLRVIADGYGKDQVSDGEFIRRACLYLLCRAPTADDFKAFLDSRDDNKHEKLIHKLLVESKVIDQHYMKAWKDIIVGREQPPANMFEFLEAFGEWKKQSALEKLRHLHSLANQEASNKLTDDAFIRRVYLDLTGTVPTPDDVKSFLDSKDSRKREKLSEKLLADAKAADHWAKVWKAAIASDKQAPEGRDPAIVAEPAAETVSVFHLRHAKAEDAVKLASDLFLAIRNSNARIAADPRTNSLILQGAPQHAETLAGILKAIDQPSAPSQRGESEPASADRVGGHASYDPATQRQLLEIDLQEAENELNLAKVELAEYQKIQKTSPGTLSAHDFRRKEAEVRQAELRLKRIKILLDAVAAKENAVPRSPLSAVEEAVVPPKNLPERIWETLGLTLEPIDEDAFDGLKSAFRGGLMVNDVRPDSPADERGIRQGDILVGLGRWETASLDNVAYVLARDDASQAGGITFHILRDGKAMVGRLSVADADLSPGPASASPAVSETSRDKATRIRLAEIDLREAQLELQGLSKEYSRIAELSKQGTVQQSEVDRVLLKKQQAELAVERAQIVLDGLKSPSPTLPRK